MAGTALDSAGGSAITGYRVYRGTAPNFVPDKSGGSNRVGTTVEGSESKLVAAVRAALGQAVRSIGALR